MLNDFLAVYELLGLPIATGIFILVISDKFKLLSVKVGGSKPNDAHDKIGKRIDDLHDEIHDLGLKIARLEAILEERK